MNLDTTAATATASANELNIVPPLATAASTAVVEQAGVPDEIRPARAFPLSQLTFATVCSESEWYFRQCGVVEANSSTASLLEAYIAGSGDEDSQVCNRRQYDTLLVAVQSLNDLEPGEVIQVGDVLVLPRLPCHQPGIVDRSALSTEPADGFANGMIQLLSSYPDDWEQPSADELEPIAESAVQNALLGVFHHFRDRYNGRQVKISAATQTHSIGGDYYLVGLEVRETIFIGSRCSGIRQRWFGLAEISAAGRLFALGDSRFTEAFGAPDLCG